MLEVAHRTQQHPGLVPEQPKRHVAGGTEKAAYPTRSVAVVDLWGRNEGLKTDRASAALRPEHGFVLFPRNPIDTKHLGVFRAARFASPLVAVGPPPGTVEKGKMLTGLARTALVRAVWGCIDLGVILVGVFLEAPHYGGDRKFLGAGDPHHLLRYIDDRGAPPIRRRAPWTLTRRERGIFFAIRSLLEGVVR